MCAIVGVIDPEAARLSIQTLQALEHRGAGSTGVSGFSRSGTLALHRKIGQPSDIFDNVTTTELVDLGLVAALGHNRYATSGSAHQHIQPVHSDHVQLAHNGNLSNTAKLRAHLSRLGIRHVHLNDSEMMAHALGTRISQGLTLQQAITELYPQLVGAFSCVALHEDASGGTVLAAFRDGFGVRPLVLGRTASGYIVASETHGLDTTGATHIRDINPGELIVTDGQELHSYQLEEPKRTKFDVFELIYFSNQKSTFHDVKIEDIRRELGRQLAREYKDIDPSSLVVGIPNSALPFAQGYSGALGIELSEQAIVRNPSVGRSFMQPTQELREQLRDRKYIFRPDLIKGRHIVLIDDSIVRMTTAGFMTRRLQEAGARSVTILLGSPPVRYPNFYGIDTPDQTELAAARMDVAEMRRGIGCDRLGFLSLDGMMRTIQKATGQPRRNFELSTFTGRYPIPIGKRDIRHIEHSGYSAQK